MGGQEGADGTRSDLESVSAPGERRGHGIAILGMGLWMAEFPSLEAWRTGERDPEAVKPLGKALDRINRRRAGVLARAIADAAAEAFEGSGVDPSTIPCVVGSSIGEAKTMIGLLDQMWRTQTPMSPANFTVSVHNASSGLLSISSKNQGYVTSMAADEDTPAMSLLEGLGLVLDTAGPVLVACGDEAAPSELVKEEPHWAMLAGALILAPVADAPAGAAIVRLVHGLEPTLEPARLTAEQAASPEAGLIDLIDAITRGEPGLLRLDRGTGRGYLADIEFAPK